MLNCQIAYIIGNIIYYINFIKFIIFNGNLLWSAFQHLFFNQAYFYILTYLSQKFLECLRYYLIKQIKLCSHWEREHLDLEESSWDEEGTYIHGKHPNFLFTLYIKLLSCNSPTWRWLTGQLTSRDQIERKVVTKSLQRKGCVSVLTITFLQYVNRCILLCASI